MDIPSLLIMGPMVLLLYGLSKNADKYKQEDNDK